MQELVNKATGKVGLKVGSVINWTAFVVQFLTTLLLTPIVISYVGKSGYGIWVLVNALSGYYGLVNVGLSSALVRHISLHATRNETDELRGVIATALSFFSVTGGVILALSFCFAGWIAGFFGITGPERPAAEMIVRLLGFATALDFAGVVLTALLNAYERFLIVGIFNLARTLIRFGVIVLFLHLGMGLFGLGLATALMSVLLIVSNLFLVRRLHGPALIGFRAATFAKLRVLLRYGSSTFLMNIVNLARTKFGHLVLAKMAGMNAVALFGIASSVVMQFNGMSASIVSVLTTRFARLDAKKQDEEMRMLFRKSLFICACISFAFGLVTWLFGERFILLWVGDGFVAAVPALQIMTLAYVLAHAQASAWNLMFGIEKHHFMAVMSTVEVAIVIAGCVFLVPKWGATGAALGTGLGMLLTKVFIQPVYVSRLVQLPLRTYFAPILPPAGIAIAIAVAAHFSGLTAFWRVCSLPVWLLSGVLVTGLFVLLCAALTHKSPFFVNPIPRSIMSMVAARTR